MINAHFPLKYYCILLLSKQIYNIGIGITTRHWTRDDHTIKVYIIVINKLKNI